MVYGKPKTLQQVLKELREGGQIVPSPAPQYPAPTPTPEAPKPKESWWDWLMRHTPWNIVGVQAREYEQAMKGVVAKHPEIKKYGWVEFAKLSPEAKKDWIEVGAKYEPKGRPYIPSVPSVEQFREYAELPFLKQIEYEFPFWATTAFISAIAPTATGIRAGLAPKIAAGGKAAIPARVAAGVLRPMAAVEVAQAKGLLKATNLLKRLNFTRYFKASPSYKTFLKAKPRLTTEGISSAEIAQIERQLRRALLAELDGNKVAAQQLRLLLTRQYPMLVFEPTIVPKPWLVMGGTGISTMTAEKWGVMTVPQRSVLLEALGVAKPTATMTWAALPAATRAVLAGVPEPEAPPLRRVGVPEEEAEAMTAPMLEEILGRKITTLEELAEAREEYARRLRGEIEAEAPVVPPVKPPMRPPGAPPTPEEYEEVMAEVRRILGEATPEEQEVIRAMARRAVEKKAIPPEEIPELEKLPAPIEGLDEDLHEIQVDVVANLYTDFIGKGVVPPYISKRGPQTAENPLGLKIGKPTLAELLTSQNYYARILGLGSLVAPLEVTSAKSTLVRQAMERAVVRKIIELRKVGGKEAPEEMAKLLDKFERAPFIKPAPPLKWSKTPPAEFEIPKAIGKSYAPYRKYLIEDTKVKGTTRFHLHSKEGMLTTRETLEEAKERIDRWTAAEIEISPKEMELFNWFRNLTRTMWEAENQVRALLGMEQIEYHEAYIRHTIDGMAERILDGRQELPPALQYWSKKIVAQQKFNPMALQRELAVDLEQYFSKDLKYLLTSMVRIGLDEIYLTRPLKIFREQVNELLVAGIMPAETMEWITNYININIMMQQSGLDKRINETFKKSGMAGVINDLLRPFGKSLGAKPFSRLANIMGRMVIAGAMGPRPKLIIRNLFQILQSTGIHGFEAVLKSQMPAPPLAQELINESLFFALYTGFEELPVELMKKFERAWLYLYGKSAVFNARQAMKAAYWDYIKYFRQKKYKDLGYASPLRTYKEPNDFLYPSERKLLLELMEQAAAVTQYQYTTMGMPGVFRNKALIPFTRLQSWWMNYFFKFNREMFHQFITGEVGYGITAGGKIPPPSGTPPEERPLYEEPERHPKLPVRARLNLLKYYIFIGAALTAMGYNRSFLFGVLPGRLAPQASVALDLYNYVSADTEQQRKKAENQLLNDSQVLVPGMLAAKDFIAFWKEGKDVLPETFFYSEEWPPGYPTWSIPQLEAFEKIRETQAKLGTTVPAKIEGEPDEIYQMPDFRGDVRRAVGESGILLYPMAERSKSHRTATTIANAELLWATYYDILPTDKRMEFRKQATTQSAITEAYLFMFGRVSSLQCPDGKGTWSWSAIHQLMKEYDIPKEAIPNYDTMVEKQKAMEWEREQAIKPIPETIPPELPERPSLEDVLKALRGEQ